MIASIAAILAAAGDAPVEALPAAWDIALRVGITPLMVLVLVFSGKWPTPQAYGAAIKRAEDAEARADKNEGKVDAMVEMFRKEVTPTLVTATTTIAEAQRLLQKIADRAA